MREASHGRLRLSTYAVGAIALEPGLRQDFDDGKHLEQNPKRNRSVATVVILAPAGRDGALGGWTDRGCGCADAWAAQRPQAMKD